jgi:hypothetical protein
MTKTVGRIGPKEESLSETAEAVPTDQVAQGTDNPFAFLGSLAALQIQLPTNEEVDAGILERASSDRNCISRWLPLLEGAGIPMPETRIIALAPSSYREAVAAFDCGATVAFPEADAIWAAYAEMGGDAFVKLGNFSAKHSWERTCRLRPGLTREGVAKHVASIMYEQMMVGCPESLAVAVRRMIPTRPAFISSEHGGMPVTRERRIFTEPDGHVACHHPYWPQEAFAKTTPEERTALETISDLAGEDLATLAPWATEAAQRLAALDPASGWSVDFLQDDAGGWWLIDVAQATRSWHHPH